MTLCKRNTLSTKLPRSPWNRADKDMRTFHDFEISTKTLAKQDQISLLHDVSFFKGLAGAVDGEILKQVQQADSSYVQLLTDRLLKQAREKQTEIFAARRAQAHKKFVQSFVDLAEKSRKFLDSFTGVLQIATGVDQRFGPLAYGAVAIIVTLGSNRKLQDEMITRMLSMFSRWLSRLEAGEEIEGSEPRVQGLVMRIYVQIVALLRASIHYYSQPSWRRLLHAATKPPKEYLQTRRNDVIECVADLMEELMLLRHRYIKDIGKQTRTQADDHHCKSTTEVARAFRYPKEALGANSMQAECEKIYRSTPTRINHQGQSRSKPVQLQQITVDMLLERQSYQAWWRCPTSCLLLLAGENARAYDVSHPCWLTPIGWTIYSRMCQTTDSLPIFCSLVAMDQRQRRAPIALGRLVLKCIIWQLLNQDHSLSRLCSEHVCSQYKDAMAKEAMTLQPDHHADSLGEELEVLFELLEDVLLIVRGRPIYIILDGIEKFEQDFPTVFFRHLLDILEKSQTKQVVIKVLTVCFSRRWPNLKRNTHGLKELKYKLGQAGQSEIMNQVFVELEWRQERVP